MKFEIPQIHHFSPQLDITDSVTIPQQKIRSGSVPPQRNGTGHASALIKRIFPCLGRQGKSEPSAETMTSHIVVRRSALPKRLKAVKATKETSAGQRLAEVAGGTTAECAAVCCCCPCGIVRLVVLTFVWLPAGLCRKAIKKKIRKKSLKILEQSRRFDEDSELQLDKLDLEDLWPDKSPSMVVLEAEEEMWSNFYGSGFWRNPSEREQPTITI